MSNPIALTGDALLEKLSTLDGLLDGERAKACGYFYVRKDGTDRINFTAFYKACAAAKGVSFYTPSPKSSDSRLSYRGHAGSSSGNLVIGAGYAKKVGIRPGDPFFIHVDTSNSYEQPRLTITPALPSAELPAFALTAELEPVLAPA